MELKELKQKYNEVIKREHKAEKYFEGRTEKECEAWMPEYLKIIQQLSLLIGEYKRLTGKEMTKEQVWEGFR